MAEGGATRKSTRETKGQPPARFGQQPPFSMFVPFGGRSPVKKSQQNSDKKLNDTFDFKSHKSETQSQKTSVSKTSKSSRKTVLSNNEKLENLRQLNDKYHKEKLDVNDAIRKIEVEIVDAKINNEPEEKIKLMKEKVEIFKTKISDIETHYNEQVNIESKKETTSSAHSVISSTEKVKSWINSNMPPENGVFEDDIQQFTSNPHSNKVQMESDEDKHNSHSMGANRQFPSYNLPPGPFTPNNYEYSRSHNTQFNQQQQFDQQNPINNENCRDHVLIEAFKSLKHRQVRDLPSFNGDNPLDFFLFISEYERSSKEFNVSLSENLGRISKALQGRARDAVLPLLSMPENVPQILQILKMNFAKKEWVMSFVMKKFRNIQPVHEKDLESFRNFYNNVFTISQAAKNVRGQNYLNNPELVLTLVDKLPPFSQDHWATYKAYNTNENDDATIDTFLAWLEVELKIVFAAHNPFAPKMQHGARPKYVERRQLHTHNEKWPKCRVCFSKDHTLLLDCDKFKRLPVNERRRMARKLTVCFKCLQPGHGAKQCEKDITCSTCGALHNNILHRDRAEHTYANFDPELDSDYSDEYDNSELTGAPETPSVKEEQESKQSQASEAGQEIEQTYANFKINNAMLRIGNVAVYGPEKFVTVAALFDEGSQSTMVDSKLAEELQLTGETVPVTYQWTGQVVKHYPNSKKVTLEISGMNKGSKVYTINQARTIENLGLPRQQIDIDRIVKLYPNIDIQKLKAIKDTKPRILIGSDNAGLIVPRQTYSYHDNGLQLTRCNLGWTIHGKIDPNLVDTYTPLSINICSEHNNDEDLNKLIEEMYKVEHFGITQQNPKLSVDDQRALELMEKTLEKVENRYQIGHLYRYENMKFPDSKAMAMKRLSYIEKKMDADPEMSKQYCNKIQEYVDKGYARKVPSEELVIQHPHEWYIPHFAVTNVNKPGKIRLVMDAKAKSHGVCLNDLLLKGPDFVPPLIAVIWRARLKKIGFIADIAEMFHQVQIRPQDRCSQRFLFRGERRTGEPDTYEMIRLIFGAVSSPSIAQFIKNYNAKLYETTCEGVSRAIIQQHYVDDYFDAADTPEQAIELITNVIKAQKDAGFKLTKFISNDQSVTNALPEEDRAKAGEDGMVRVLGLSWHLPTDCLTVKFDLSILKKLKNSTEVPSKREVLKAMMSIFDPLGIVQPVTIRLKIIFQDLWRRKVNWDDKIPEDLHKKWIIWLQDTTKMNAVTIPRYYFPQIEAFSVAELHTFCDASDKGYAAVVYLRVVVGCKAHTSFVSAKSKVAPLKHLTVPRLELQACVMGSELAKTIEREIALPITRRYFWTDSKITLSWFRSKERLNAFVGSRVTKIFSDTDRVDEWHWIPSELNSADLATKAHESFDSERWLNGPKFIAEDKQEWPKFEMPEMNEHEMIGFHQELDDQIFIGVTANHTLFKLPDINRFSQFDRLIRATAHANKMIWALQQKKTDRPTRTELFKLNVADLQQARHDWYREIQSEEYAEEIHCIRTKGYVKVCSKLHHHSPFLHDGILRMKGRVKDPLMPFEEQNPVILPGNHKFTQLLIKKYHEKNFHVGVHTVINNLRQLYDIIGCKQAVKKIFNECERCRELKKKPNQPEMGNLPLERVTPFQRPFTSVGLDYFGPITTTMFRKKVMRYAALFTCLVTRACHVEVVHSLTTNSAIMAIQRFICIRGIPKKIFSDNATCFRGAAKELIEFKEHMVKEGGKLADKFQNYGIEWSFIPPASPNFGGCWERKVQSIKVALRAALNEEYPNDETLTTIICEVVNTVNNTPLSEISNDPHDLRAITPNDALLGGPNCTQFDVTDAGKSLNQNEWKMAQRIADRFWQRWVVECRPMMKQRSKWYDNRNFVNLEPEDIVLVADEQVKRNNWLKGKVEEVYPGKDGIVRVALVKTMNGKLKRPTSKLILLLRPGTRPPLAVENVA